MTSLPSPGASLGDPPGTPPSPAPRRIATPTWLDLRLVLGVILVLASVLIGARVVAGASDTRAAVTVTRDLAVGTVLTGDDLRLSQVQLPDGGTGRYLSAMRTAIGKRLTRAVSAGELLPAAAVASPRAQTTLTIPLTAGAAPALRTGQRIELWVSSATCASVVLLPDVTVQSVRADAGNSFGVGTGAQNVVISVDPSLASRVIEALSIDGATVRAGVLVGAVSATPGPSLSSVLPSVPSVSLSVPSVPASSNSGGGGSGADPSSDLAACSSARPSR